MPELKASLDTIRRAASEMISSSDEKQEELMTEQAKEAEVETPAQNNPFALGLVEKITETVETKGFEVVDKREPGKAVPKEEKKPVEKKTTKKKESEEKKQIKKTSVKNALKENKEKKKTEKIAQRREEGKVITER